MTVFVDYDLILSDFVTALKGAGLAFAKQADGTAAVFKDASDFDFDFVNMPMADCRIRRVDPTLVGINDTYYADVTIDVEIACFDMTLRAKCAKMRNDLTNAVQRYFQQNPRFSSGVETVQVGPVDFSTGESKGQGEFVASAIAEFHAFVYTG